MTTLLEKVLKQATSLPETEQNHIAELISDEINESSRVQTSFGEALLSIPKSNDSEDVFTRLNETERGSSQGVEL